MNNVEYALECMILVERFRAKAEENGRWQKILASYGFTPQPFNTASLEMIISEMIYRADNK